VAHRWGLDRAEDVERLVLMDIAPTREMWRRLDAHVATRFWPATSPPTRRSGRSGWRWKSQCAAVVADHGRGLEAEGVREGAHVGGHRALVVTVWWLVGAPVPAVVTPAEARLRPAVEEQQRALARRR